MHTVVYTIALAGGSLRKSAVASFPPFLGFPASSLCPGSRMRDPFFLAFALLKPHCYEAHRESGMNIIRKAELREGRWRNGMGVSWDIASDPPGTDDFGWRFAIARIDLDVPFSLYPQVDRIFTLIEGNGLDLDFEGLPSLAVHQRFVPHPYPCDVKTYCRLREGPCRALNLFMRRGLWRASADVLSKTAEIAHHGPILFFSLQGNSTVKGEMLEPGDAAIADGHVTARTEGFLYAAKLSRW